MSDNLDDLTSKVDQRCKKTGAKTFDLKNRRKYYDKNN